MSQNNWNSNRSKNRRNALRIVLLFSIIILSCLLIWIFGRGINNLLNNSSQTPPKTTSSPVAESKTPTPTPKPASIPKATLEIDGIEYAISGTQDTKQASAPMDNTLKAGMGKGSVANFNFESSPDSYSITLLKDNEPVFTSKTSVILSDDIPQDGEYQGVCEAKWDKGEYIGS
ncbi:MAG: hypothetical protein GX625_12845, partial [Clostridiaceae bacterium]|nr:hypothetical protein [Clostridiaceae bacterium]